MIVGGRKEKRPSRTTAIMKETLDRVVTSVENNKNSSRVTSKRTDISGCSVPEVRAYVRSLSNLDEESDLYISSTELFEQKPEREIYIQFQSENSIVHWLNHHFNNQNKW